MSEFDKLVDAEMPEQVLAWAKHADSVPKSDSPVSASVLALETAQAVASVLGDNCSDACVHPMYCTAFATTPMLPPATKMAAEETKSLQRTFAEWAAATNKVPVETADWRTNGVGIAVNSKPEAEEPAPVQSTTLLDFRGLQSVELARMSSDGIFTFSVEANDDNAKQFLDCIGKVLGRPVVEVHVKKVLANQEVPA